MSTSTRKKAVAEARKRMEAAAKALNFQEAAVHRDEMYALMKKLEKIPNSKL
jgi:excinuclease UvrABC helicase subunit UvrB